MTMKFIEKFTLGVAGLSAVGIGGMITFAPHAFYAGYGIVLGEDPSLLSELRAPGAGLSALGLLMLLGLWRSSLGPSAISAALVVFLAFPAGRLVGLAADGMPSTGILGALSFEVVVAALCLFAFRKRLTMRNIQS